MGAANGQTTGDSVFYYLQGSDIFGVDQNTLNTTQDITIPGITLTSVSIAPGGGLLYATGDNNLYVIKVNSGSIKTIPLGANTYRAISNNNGTRIYVSGLDTTWIIDATNATYPILSTIGAGSDGVNNNGIALNPSNSKLYVANFNNTIQVYNAQTGAFIHQLTTNGTEDMIVSNQTGELIAKSGVVIYFYDTSTDTFITTFAVDSSVATTLSNFAMSSDGQTLFVGMKTGSVAFPSPQANITAISVTSPAVLYSVTTTAASDPGNFTKSLALSNDNTILYATNATGPNIIILNLVQKKMTGFLVTSNSPWITSGFLSQEATPFSTLHQVSFQVVTFFGAIQWSQINVSVYNFNTGVLLFTGLTDNTGTASFNLLGAQKYHITFTNQSQGINQTMDLFPTDSSYTINVLPNPFASFTSFFQTNQSYQIATGINSNINGTGTGFINATYLDTSSTTTFVNMTLWQQDTLNGGPPTFVSFKNFTLAPAANEVVNGDMENGLPSIPISNNVVTAQSTNFSHTGTHSMFVNITGGGPVLELGGYATSSLTHYNLTVWVYSPGVSQTGFQIGLQETGGAFRSLQSSSASIPANTWTQVSVEMNTLSGWTATSNIILIGFGSTPTTPIYFDDISLTSNSATGQFVISSASGKTFQVFINSTGSTFGNSTRNYAVNFPGPLVSLGFPETSWYNYITLFILIIVLAVFTRITTGIGVLVTDACAAIAITLGWFNPLGSNILNFSAVALVFFVGLAIYVIDKESGA